MNDTRNDEMSGHAAQGLARQTLGAGRLGTYTALGGLAGSVPLPWVPDAFARRVRGALAHDVAARHGLSITLEARNILAEPSGVDGPRGLLGEAVHYAATRLLGRLGPLGMVTPLRNAVQTFALGHLFHRYLEGARRERSVRIDVDEARRVRGAIDQAILQAVTGDVAAKPEDVGRAPEDFRDQVTALSDALIIGATSFPSWIVRRLDAAFDDVLARTQA